MVRVLKEDFLVSCGREIWIRIIKICGYWYISISIERGDYNYGYEDKLMVY